MQKFHPLFDEILILDLSTKVKTKLISHSHNAKIINFPYNKNLTEAKNFALTQASSEWILFLDDGETLNFERTEDFEKLLNEDVDGYYLRHTNISTSEKLKPYASLRLFKNSAKFQFEGSGIEDAIYLNNSFKSKLAPGLLLVPTSITDLSLLKQQLKLQNISNFYFLAYYSKLFGHYKLALKQLGEGLKEISSNQAIGPHLVRLLIEVFIAQKEYGKALQAIKKGLEIYPDYSDLLFLQGVCLYSLGQFSNSINCFHDCLEREIAPLYYHPYQGVTTHLPLYYLGKAYKAVGEHQQAVISFTRSLQECPLSHEAIEPLVENLLAFKDLQEVIDYLDVYFDFNSIYGITQLAHAFYNLGYYQLAHLYLLELEKRIELDESLSIKKAFCLLTSGRYLEAQETIKDIYPDNQHFLETLKLKCIIFWLNKDFSKAKKIIESIKNISKNQILADVLFFLHKFISKDLRFSPPQIIHFAEIKQTIFRLITIFINLPDKKLLIAAEDTLQLFSGNHYLLDLAKLYFSHDLLSDTERILKNLLETSFFSSDLYYLLGQLKQKEGNYAFAAQMFQQALNLEPGHHETILALSATLNLMSLEIINLGLQFYPDSELLQIKKEVLEKLSEKN